MKMHRFAKSEGLNKIARSLLVTLAIIYISGCRAVGNSSSSSSGSWGTPPTAQTVYPLELIITSQYEAGGPTTTEATCQIPVGSAAGTSLACTNAAGAAGSAVAIPEARLYFSNLTFTINAGDSSVANGCEILFVQPFSYKASTSATFSAPWMSAGSEVDCSMTNAPIDCYGGVGRDVVTGFPTYTATYIMTALSLTTSFTTKSANYRHWGSNRFATNNLVIRNAAHVWQNGDSYVANTYKDYYFACVDRWWQPVFEITLTLTDVDITGVYPNVSQGTSTINQKPDWDATSWDY